MWKSIFASVCGTSHILTSVDCQDYCEYENLVVGNNEVLLVGISDGAGSATQSRLGAQMAVRSILSNIKNILMNNFIDFQTFTREQAEQVVEETQQYLYKIAEENLITVNDLSCTLLAACIFRNISFFFQVGDGGWVVNTDEGLISATWPFTGEYANETKFITSHDAIDYLQFSVIDRPIFAIAGFTDGLQSLILDYSQQKPHDGFFNPIFQTLLNSADISSLSNQLLEFLNSELINQRTDDDKTLFLSCQ
jgi:hypothetical protein